MRGPANQRGLRLGGDTIKVHDNPKRPSQGMVLTRLHGAPSDSDFRFAHVGAGAVNTTHKSPSVSIRRGAGTDSLRNLHMQELKSDRCLQTEH